MIHLVLRDAWDMPQDDELVEASLGSEWCDLAPMEADVAAAARSAAELPAKDVLSKRLRALLPENKGLHVFMDRNPFAALWSREAALRVDIVVALKPEAWDAATRALLTCEAGGIYLARRYDALFFAPPESGKVGEVAGIRAALQEQVAHATAFAAEVGSSGVTKATRGSSGFGLEAGALESFEDLAANVAAVLHGTPPPGWHRLAWTPHGVGAVPHLTY